MVQRALELVGVRVVLQDLHTYLSGARQIESATQQVNRANERWAASSAAAGTAATKAMNIAAAQAAAANKASASAAAALATSSSTTAPTVVKNAALKQANDDKREAEKLNKQLTAASKAADAANIREAASLAAVARAQKKLNDARLQTVKSGLRTAGFIGATAVVGIASGAIAAASQYEKTLTQIDNLTELTTQQTQDLGKSILDMTRTLPTSANDLGGAAYNVLSSGISDVDEALKITELSAKASAIGLGDVADVARTITSTMNAYAGSGIKASDITDIFTATVQQGAIGVGELNEGLGRVIPVAANLGINIDEVGATLASLTNAGLPASQAFTAILGIMNQLTRSTPEARDALESVGLTVDDLRNTLQEKGFVATMELLAKKFEGNITAIRPLLPEVRGLNGFASAFNSTGNRTSEILDKIRHSSGITNQAFEKASKTFSFQANLLKTQLNTALILIGQDILPEVTSALTDLLSWWRKNEEAIRDFVTGAIHAAIEAIKSLATGIGVIIDIFKDMPGGTAAAAAGVIALGAAFAWALPGGPVAVGLLGIVALIGQVKSHRTDIIDSVNDFLGFKALGNLNLLGLKDNKGGDGGSGGGFTTAPGFNPDTNTIANTNIELAKLPRNLEDVTGASKETSKAAKKAAEELKQVASEFLSSSKAAREVKSLTSEMKLFGEVSQELADAFDLTAKEAGAVQALDAVEAAEEKVAKKSWELEKTLATVAEAFKRNSTVAAKIVLELSKTALEAAQSAGAALFSKPTKEEANLQVQLAQGNLASTRLHASTDPRLEALKKQQEALAKSTQDQDKAVQEDIKAIDSHKEASIAFIQHQIDALERIKPLDDNQAAGLQRNIDMLKAQQAAVEDSAKREADRKEKEAADKQAKAEKEGSSLEKQIASVEKLNETIDKQNAKTQSQIDLITGQEAVWKAQLVAADQTLLSLGEQKAKFIEVKEAISLTSGQVRELGRTTGEDVVPEMGKMREAVEAAKSAFQVLVDEKIRGEAGVEAGFDAAAVKANILAAALWEAADGSGGGGGAQGLATATTEATKQIKSAMTDFRNQLLQDQNFGTDPNTPPPGPPQNDQGNQSNKKPGVLQYVPKIISTLPGILPGIITRASGGYVNSPSMTVLGEGSRPELVLPLTNLARSKELLTSMPPAIFSAITASAGKGGGSSYSIENVTLPGVRDGREFIPELEAYFQKRESSKMSLASIGVAPTVN